MQAYYYTEEEGSKYSSGIFYTSNKDEKEAFKDLLLIKLDKDFKQQWIQRIEQTKSSKDYKFYLNNKQIIVFCIKKALEKEVSLSNDMTYEERTQATLLLKNSTNRVVGFFFEEKTGQINKIPFFEKNGIDQYHITQFNLKRFNAFNSTTFMAEFYKKAGQDIMLRAIIN